MRPEWSQCAVVRERTDELADLVVQHAGADHACDDVSVVVGEGLRGDLPDLHVAGAGLPRHQGGGQQKRPGWCRVVTF